MANDHDSGYKSLFSTPELVRDLILGFVPDEWLHSLDYTTLEKVPGSYVSEDFRNRVDDIVWRVKVGGEWVYLYLLIEFQSSVDKYMALRMMVYVGLLYQDLIKRGDVLADGRLPPILPIVLYNGSPRWTAVCDVFELIPAVPGLVEQFKPQLKYLLIDENVYSDSELSSLKNLVAAVFRIEHPASPETIGILLSLLEEWLIDRPDLRRMFALWIRATLMRKTEYRIVLPQLDDLQELKVMLAERLEEWALGYKAEGVQLGMQQGKAEGKAEGKVEGVQLGEALALQKLLSKRFGAMPSEILEKIASASREQIEAWFDQAIDAKSVVDVFGPTPY
jgi:predicted transposase YdaD